MLTPQDLRAIDDLIVNRLSNTVTKDQLDSAIKKSQDEIISRLMSVLVHFPTRDEVKQIIEESPKINGIKAGLNDLKDYVMEFREDFEVRDTFTQSRLSNSEARLTKLGVNLA